MFFLLRQSRKNCVFVYTSQKHDMIVMLTEKTKLNQKSTWFDSNSPAKQKLCKSFKIHFWIILSSLEYILTMNQQKKHKKIILKWEIRNKNKIKNDFFCHDENCMCSCCILVSSSCEHSTVGVGVSVWTKNSPTVH